MKGEKAKDTMIEVFKVQVKDIVRKDKDGYGA